METYEIDTVFGFGKYIGHNLRTLAPVDPGYIEWCILNIDSFHIEPETLIQLREEGVSLPLSAAALNILMEKQKQHESSLAEEDDYRDDGMYDDDGYYENTESRTFGRYAGTYAQDEAGFSDEDIDNIFDGEPDAYWNID